MRAVIVTVCCGLWVIPGCFRATSATTLIHDGSEPRRQLRYPAHVPEATVTIEYRSSGNFYDSHSSTQHHHSFRGDATGTLEVSRPGDATIDVVVRSRSFSVEQGDEPTSDDREKRAKLTYARRERSLSRVPTGIGSGTRIDQVLPRILPSVLPDRAVGPGAYWDIAENNGRTRWIVVGFRDRRVVLRGVWSYDHHDSSGDGHHSSSAKTQVDVSIDLDTMHLEAELTTDESSSGHGRMTSSHSSNEERARVVVGPRGGTST